MKKSWRCIASFVFAALIPGVAGQAAVAAQTQGAHYVGALVCASCHESKFEGFRQTAHHLTSRLPDEKSVLGSFLPEKATMSTRNPNLWFRMDAREDGFYQTAFQKSDSEMRQREERIGVVIGSGKIGQTYLFWKKRGLRQLPVSYSRFLDKWINSPGYRDGEVNFSRTIVPRCLECHATFFEAVSGRYGIYRRDNFILGISCERCHGPGGEHVSYQLEHPDESQAGHIVHPGRLDPVRQMEICAQCHSGTGVSIQPPFSFRPGESLSRYIVLEDLEAQNQIGVHTTNQMARLSQSQCFQNSDGMTCISCHNPHRQERGDLKLFSRKCMVCHQPHTCGMADRVGDTHQGNCIDCHMPWGRDVNTPVETTSGLEFPFLRDHTIAVYPQVTKRFMKGQKVSPPQP